MCYFRSTILYDKFKEILLHLCLKHKFKLLNAKNVGYNFFEFGF